jgi:hypothetical protein
MKVTSTTKENSAAVVGYQEVSEMTLANSPEFIAIFQKSLYQYHSLAMVRETITNGWDAHIEKGIDTPIQIDITDTMFTIKDFGLGIPHSLMGKIYGTIGEGTKSGDSRSTGGLGLGCKSPHGYTDAFEVISCCNGTKTIYQIVKASKLTQGRPAIVKIMEAPTTETGLTVNIPLKPHDASTIVKYARNVVYSGDIPAVITFKGAPDNEIRGINLSREANAFTVLMPSDAIQLPTVGNSLNVRYANIVYRFPDLEGVENMDYITAYKEVVSLLSVVKDDCYDYGCLIIQAAPDSLVVHPSRESLSVTSENIKELTKLLNTFIEGVKKAEEPLWTLLPKHIEKVIDETDAIIGRRKKEGRHDRYSIDISPLPKDMPLTVMAQKLFNIADSKLKETTLDVVHRILAYKRVDSYEKLAFCKLFQLQNLKSFINPTTIFNQKLPKGAYCDLNLLDAVMKQLGIELSEVPKNDIINVDFSDVLELSYGKARDIQFKHYPDSSAYLLNLTAANYLEHNIDSSMHVIPLTLKNVQRLGEYKVPLQKVTPLMNKVVIITDVLNTTFRRIRDRIMFGKFKHKVDTVTPLVIKGDKKEAVRKALIAELEAEGYEVVDLFIKSKAEQQAHDEIVNKRKATLALNKANKVKTVAVAPLHLSKTANDSVVMVEMPASTAAPMETPSLLLLLNKSGLLSPEMKILGDTKSPSIDLYKTISALQKLTKSSVYITKRAVEYRKWLKANTLPKGQNNHVVSWIVDAIEELYKRVKLPNNLADALYLSHYCSSLSSVFFVSNTEVDTKYGKIKVRYDKFDLFRSCTSRDDLFITLLLTEKAHSLVKLKNFAILDENSEECKFLLLLKDIIPSLKPLVNEYPEEMKRVQNIINDITKKMTYSKRVLELAALLENSVLPNYINYSMMKTFAQNNEPDDETLVPVIKLLLDNLRKQHGQPKESATAD